MKPNKVQEKLRNYSGLVMNFCLNVVSLKELSNVKNMIQTVGNLAVLKEVQQNNFLLQVGIQAIIKQFRGNRSSGVKRLTITEKHIKVMV